MSTSLYNNICDDIVSVDDVIDLNQDYLSEGSAKEYRISLHSIDDDELRLFHRNLVTPASSVCYSDDDSLLLHKSMVRQRFIPPSRVQRPPSRGESVMLFKKINNGDEDVTSFDLVSSELRDFIDTDFMMEGLLSLPVSRSTVTKTASSNISKFHTSFLEQPKEKNDSNIKSPLMTSNNRKKFGNTPTSSKSRLNSYKSQEQPVSRSIASVPESKANHRYIDRHNNNQQQQQNQSIQSGSRDEHSYKQIPKRLITTINKPISLRERVNTKRQQQDKRDETSVENASTNRTNAVRSYGKPEAQLNYQHQATPRATRKSIPVSNNYASIYSRNRSDTSSSDEELVEEYGTWRDHPISTKDFVIPQYHRSSFSAIEIYAHNSRMKQRYHSNLDQTKSISSPRLITMSSHKIFPIRNYHSTATTTTTTTTVTEDEAVTDSAKQVLACIRERRKSSMILAADHSPKLASSTRLINSSASSSSQRHYLNQRNKSSNNRRVDFLADNDHRALNTVITRLPQRTVYR